MRRWVLPVVAAAVLGTVAAAEGDPVAGQDVFQACKSCHQIGEGARHRIGPHLNDILGKAAAAHEDFRYSGALKDAGAEGLVWEAEALDAFLADPRGFASGTRMRFKGLDDAQDRADVIAYLASYSTLAAAAPVITLDPAILAITGDVDYGAYLASECTSCHQAGGGDTGIPSITRWPEESFVIAMHAYKQKARENPVMQMMAGRLGDEEIAALAAYFAQLEN